MRYMHPVGGQESFVASGEYIHLKNGAPTGGVELWAIHEQPDGAHKIRVDDDGRATKSGSALIEAWRSPENGGAAIERVDIRAYGSNEDPIKILRATYSIVDNAVLEAGISADSMDRVHVEIALPERYVISPRSLAFAGYEAYRIAEAPQTTTQVISYFPSLKSDYAYRPVVFPMTYNYLRQENVCVDEQEFAARVYEQVNPSTNEKALIWVNTHHILLKYETADQAYGALLKNYAHRPDM